MPPEREYVTRSAGYFLVKSAGLEFRWRQEGCCVVVCEAWDGGTMVARGQFRVTGDLEHTVEVYMGEMEKKIA